MATPENTGHTDVRPNASLTPDRTPVQGVRHVPLADSGPTLDEAVQQAGEAPESVLDLAEQHGIGKGLFLTDAEACALKNELYCSGAQKDNVGVRRALAYDDGFESDIEPPQPMQSARSTNRDVPETYVLQQRWFCWVPGAAPTTHPALAYQTTSRKEAEALAEALNKNISDPSLHWTPQVVVYEWLKSDHGQQAPYGATIGKHHTSIETTTLVSLELATERPETFAGWVHGGNIRHGKPGNAFNMGLALQQYEELQRDAEEHIECMTEASFSLMFAQLAADFLREGGISPKEQYFELRTFAARLFRAGLLYAKAETLVDQQGGGQ